MENISVWMKDTAEPEGTGFNFFFPRNGISPHISHPFLMDNSVAECELVNVKKRPKEEEFHNVSSLFYLCAFCGGQLKN